MSFSTEFSEIKEARRADDDLPQGDWARENKVAEWARVKQLAVDLLQTRTKDLQLAAWLSEALTHQHGFPGLYSGMTLMREIIMAFWDKLYPAMDDGLAVRAGKISWLNTTLAPVIETIPLTPLSEGGYSLRHWNEAKEVDNVARRDPAAAKRLVEEENKLTSDIINKSVAASPEAFYESLYSDLVACQDSFKLLDNLVDMKFAAEAPSLANLKNAIESCLQLVTRIAKEKGMLGGAIEVSSKNEGSVSTPIGVEASGRLGSREEALRKLAEVAQYFRANEPHSPVAYLVDRAAKWGHMTFDQWLQEVIKDQTQLGAVHELLGITPPSSG
jgi:type VI secretion system protein ImpA